MGNYWAHGWCARSGFLALALSYRRFADYTAWHLVFDVFAKLVSHVYDH